jgi:hypothetical protein
MKYTPSRGCKQIADLIIGGYLLYTEEARTIVASLLPLHVPLMRKKRGRLREEHGKGAYRCIADLVLHSLPAPTVRQFFKGCLYDIEHVLI